MRGWGRFWEVLKARGKSYHTASVIEPVLEAWAAHCWRFPWLWNGVLDGLAMSNWGGLGMVLGGPDDFGSGPNFARPGGCELALDRRCARRDGADWVWDGRSGGLMAPSWPRTGRSNAKAIIRFAP